MMEEQGKPSCSHVKDKTRRENKNSNTVVRMKAAEEFLKILGLSLVLKEVLVNAEFNILYSSKILP